jgi:hypothetical protein
LATSEAIANSFDARDLSGLQTSTGSQFTTANTSARIYLRQSNIATLATAAFTGSDWTYYQRIEAEVTPVAWSGSTRGVGLAVRFVDADNYYSLTVRSSNVVQLRRRLNGIETVLGEAPWPTDFAERRRLSLVVEGDRLVGTVGNTLLEAEDTALAHGRAALVTDYAQADFDNVYVAPTSAFSVFSRSYDGRNQGGPELNYIGGHWEKDTLESPKLRQSDTSGTAIAHIGVPIRDQTVSSAVTVNQFAPTATAVASFGLIARYTNPQNYYVLSVRSSNTFQIRKIVNGVTTVLAATDIGVTPGTYHRFDFRVVGNELHAFLDGVRHLSTVDNSHATGSYGITTYRTDAYFDDLSVSQP